MLFTLIAAIALGLGTAGLVSLLPRLVGRRAPRWTVPLAGGAAMFAFMLWAEYSWYERMRAGLPEDAVIAETYEHASWFQPWTVLRPRVWRFAAVEPVDGPAPEGMLLGDVWLIARFAQPVRIPHIFDCAKGRRAAVPASGLPEDPAALDWTAPEGDPLIAAACAAREGD